MARTSLTRGQHREVQATRKKCSGCPPPSSRRWHSLAAHPTSRAREQPRPTSVDTVHWHRPLSRSQVELAQILLGTLDPSPQDLKGLLPLRTPTSFLERTRGLWGGEIDERKPIAFECPLRIGPLAAESHRHVQIVEVPVKAVLYQQIKHSRNALVFAQILHHHCRFCCTRSVRSRGRLRRKAHGAGRRGHPSAAHSIKVRCPGV
mmetsp:Transcript_102423/g.234942  ORF Transcript_102423/g.234942 Transcript_102423/m.234942 type:complete len:205 (+) Transcript_102423:489-1103(+)